jgi:hypothetical protein
MASNVDAVGPPSAAANDYSQYPPGTIFFDKLKRKSTAIINFMNLMTS